MPIFDAVDLANLRQDLYDVQLETMANTGKVKRLQTGVINSNHPEIRGKTLVTVVPFVPCEFREANAQEQIIAGKPQGQSVITVEIPAGIDVKRSDVFEIDAKGIGEPGMSLNIIGIIKQSDATEWFLLTTEK